MIYFDLFMILNVHDLHVTDPSLHILVSATIRVVAALVVHNSLVLFLSFEISSVVVGVLLDWLDW